MWYRCKEGRYVVATDILGPFLHADMKDTVHMVLKRTIAEHIAKLDPTIYKKYIWHIKKGKPMLYMQLKKALYGMLQAALLFWKLLLDILIDWGFKINSYNQCIVNKMMSGRQWTILWHVDNLKIFHVDKNVVEDIIKP